MPTMNAAALSGAFLGLPVEVRFGAGCLSALPEILARDGVRRVMVVTGRSLADDADMIERVAQACDGRLAGVFCQTVPHVPREAAIAAAEQARALNADALLSFGGSTQNDTAKAAAWALAQDIRQAEEFEPYAIRFEYPSTRVAPAMTAETVPIYAVPTTLSAGEFTNIAGITDRASGHKQLYQDRRIASRAVLLDPQLTLKTPSWLWFSSGIKAIDHCVEAFLSLRSQPYTDALAAQALGLLLQYLPATARDPDDLAARVQCQIAAWLSVAGLTNVSLGLSHGVGHQLGAICGVAHGHTACVVLRHVLEFNREATAARQEKLLSLARVHGDPGEGGEADLGGRILALVRDELKLPWRLRDVGVKREAIPRVAHAAMGDALIASNPRPVRSVDEVVTLLEKAW